MRLFSKVFDWSRCLSIGEQQRLSFIRLFTLFTYSNISSTNTLVLIDESTSGIDIHTESIIYQTMLRLHIWFITLSHRLSLKSYHSIELKLDGGIIENLNDNENEIDTNETDPSVLENKSIINEIKVKKIYCYSLRRSLIAMWHLIHLPFDPKDHKTLRIQVSVIF